MNDRCLIRAGLVTCLIAAGLSFHSSGFAADGAPGSELSLVSEARPSSLSASADAIIRLAETGVEEEVILAYIENSQSPFELSAEDIIYLKDLGIAAPVIAAMLHQDTALRDQQVQAGVVTGTTNQFTYDQRLYPPSTNLAPAVTPEPVYVSNAPSEVTYFYDTLQPYGTWIDLEGYGWCWQPHVVVINRTWRPYWHSGRWIWTDLGWYWCSDYSWGWAPFHYGRWHRHPRCGWVWFPDRVWAPAWVCWRYSDRHCGWAPLPRGAHFVAGHGFRFNNVSVGVSFNFGLGADLFNFVEIGRLHEPNPHLHAVPEGRANEIYNQTTVINNYVSARDNRIINPGIGVERVAAVSRSEIRKVRIQDAPAIPGRVIKPERVEADGAAPVLYRHPLTAPAKPIPVTAQKIDQRHPVVRPIPARAPGSTPQQGGGQPGRIRPAPAQPVPPAQIPSRTQPSGPTAKPTPPPTAKPEPGKGRENRPFTPPSAPTQPTSPQPGRSPASPPPAGSRPVPSQPQRPESPKGREQSLSNGRSMRPSTPARPPAPGPFPQNPAESSKPVSTNAPKR